MLRVSIIATALIASALLASTATSKPVMALAANGTSLTGSVVAAPITGIVLASD